MVRVTVNGIERDLREVSVPWLREHIEPTRNQGLPVCVKVSIKFGDIDMGLSTPGCAPSGHAHRPPRPKEKELFDLWDKQGLNTEEFSIEQLNAFLNAVKNL